MAEDCRCQNCGDAGRFTVVVTNDRVSGQWCRNACSRNCADILAQHGKAELENVGGVRGGTTIEVRRQLSGAA